MLTGPRFFVDTPLAGLEAGAALALPPTAARHVQVLRLQPGAPLVLFDGHGGEWAATVAQMGRSNVAVALGAHAATEREAARAVHLAIGMPANERMDWLVEKATELGAASIQPLACARSVLRLAGERADKKRAHWRGVASAACEQCGRNRVPLVHPVADFATWLRGLPATPGVGDRLLLAWAGGAEPLAVHAARLAAAQPVQLLSGPEGGLDAAEEALALDHGFAPATLGPRVLRAETAPLAALAALTLR